jgi:hypothetical protein
VKLGLITPLSSDFPFLGKEFKNGVNLILPEDIHLHEVNVEKGEPNEVLPAFRKLIVDKEVDIVIGFLDSNITNTVKGLITATQTPCILSGMGTRLPLPKIASSPFIFHNTYQIWESCWLAGKYFSQKFGDKYAALTSFFDCGYPQTYACVQGASGGKTQPQFISITHKDELDKEWEVTSKNFGEMEPEFTFISYYGKEREEILGKLSEIDFPEERIISSPGIANGYGNITRITSWHPELKNKENIEFKELYKQKYSKSPSEFSLLGYETISLILNSIEIINSLDPDKFKEQLLGTTLQGPRGTISFIQETQSSYCGHYSILNNEFVKMSYPKEEILLEINRNTITNQIGWQNTYLCK